MLVELRAYLSFITTVRPYRYLKTSNLNNLYEAASLLEFHALSEVLDKVAPYNA